MTKQELATLTRDLSKAVHDRVATVFEIVTADQHLPTTKPTQEQRDKADTHLVVLLDVLQACMSTQAGRAYIQTLLMITLSKLLAEMAHKMISVDDIIDIDDETECAELAEAFTAALKVLS